MTALKGHHRPRVYKLARLWWSECDSCGCWQWRNDWHTAYFTARDHAESSLR